ncbi:MAG: hypothetical protein JNL87_22255, partial [Burkholderiaceae bacterium]|nr:hypothetical protein [Burkholderiaceae bacterium]
MTTLSLEPMPAPAGPSRPDGRELLTQCLVLALLIHVLVVLVFGSAAGGSARPGEGVWGTLNIRLTGSDATGRNEATVAAEAHSGPAGTATRQRWGGAVRSPDLSEPAPRAPGAAREGVWQPQPSVAATEADAPRPSVLPPTPAT